MKILASSRSIGLLAQAASVGGAATDPYWANVVLLAVNDNAADGTTTFVDQSPVARAITRNGSAVYDDAQAPAGMTTSMLLDGTLDFLSVAHHADFAFGAGAFTVEGWVRFAALGVYQNLYSKRSASTKVRSVLAQLVGTTNRLRALGTVDSATWGVNIDGGLAAINTWYHWTIGRTGNIWYFGINGSLASTTVAGTLPDDGSAVRIGSESDAWGVNGWMCSIRVTNGVCRHTTNPYTVPTLPLPTS